MSSMHFTGFDRIVADPAYCDGQPRIDGTRITVSAILSYLAGGLSAEQIVAEYPKLTVSDVYLSLAFASAYFNDRYLPLHLSSVRK